MGCTECGCATPRRTCRDCILDDRYGEPRDRDWPECPECGGITSGNGVVCKDCRSVGGDDA